MTERRSPLSFLGRFAHLVKPDNAPDVHALSGPHSGQGRYGAWRDIPDERPDDEPDVDDAFDAERAWRRSGS